jgi:hypothetical protein
METQNEQLEKILKLIQENFEAKKISNKDLNEIIFYSAGLIKVENLGLVQANKAFNYQWKFDDIGEIPNEEAENSKKLFVTNFGKNPALANKIFRFESKLISDLLKLKKDLVVYFSQDKSGNLCVVLNTGSDFYEITTSSSSKIIENDRLTRSNLFKGKLKTTIETTLNKSYTEYITIPYISNFDQFKGVFPKTIVLVPAISVTKYAGRMTLIMNFEDFSGKTMSDKGPDNSYDTFTPHP